MSAVPARYTVSILILGLTLAACGGGASGGARQMTDFCDSKAFTPVAQSEYVLPYAVNATFTMFQGNCPADPAWGHHDMLPTTSTCRWVRPCWRCVPGR